MPSSRNIYLFRDVFRFSSRFLLGFVHIGRLYVISRPTIEPFRSSVLRARVPICQRGVYFEWFIDVVRAWFAWFDLRFIFGPHSAGRWTRVTNVSLYTLSMISAGPLPLNPLSESVNGSSLFR